MVLPAVITGVAFGILVGLQQGRFSHRAVVPGLTSGLLTLAHQL